MSWPDDPRWHLSCQPCKVLESATPGWVATNELPILKRELLHNRRIMHRSWPIRVGWAVHRLCKANFELCFMNFHFRRCFSRPAIATENCIVRNQVDMTSMTGRARPVPAKRRARMINSRTTELMHQARGATDRHPKEASRGNDLQKKECLPCWSLAEQPTLPQLSCRPASQSR